MIFSGREQIYLNKQKAHGAGRFRALLLTVNTTPALVLDFKERSL